MNGLDNIVNKIIADAEAQAAETLAKAQAEADTILENYRANAAVENKQIIDNASKAAAEKELRMHSVAELEGRKRLLAVKQELINQAFDRALEKLLHLPQDEYLALLANMAAKASQTKDEEIVLSPADAQQYGAQIVAAANAICGGKLTLAAETRPIGGGLILKKGKTEINCELETQVGMLRDALAIEIANVLFA